MKIVAYRHPRFEQNQIVVCVHYTPGITTGQRYIVEGYDIGMLVVLTLAREPVGAYWPWRFAFLTLAVEDALNQGGYINGVRAYAPSSYGTWR